MSKRKIPPLIDFKHLKIPIKEYSFGNSVLIDLYNKP